MLAGRVLVFVGVFACFGMFGGVLVCIDVCWCVLYFGVWWCVGVCLQLVEVLLHFPGRCRSSTCIMCYPGIVAALFSHQDRRTDSSGMAIVSFKLSLLPPAACPNAKQKSHPKVKNMKPKASAEHNRKAENTETCREKDKECQKG